MKYGIVLTFLALLLFSCNGEDTNTKVKKNKTAKKHKGGREIIRAGSTTQYTGKPGQLVIVAEGTEYIDEIAAVFDSIFGAPIRPYYPPTPYFRIHQRTHKEFKKLSTSLRNVIELKIDEKIEKGQPKMFIYDSYYSETQLYTKLEAHDISDLYNLLLREVKYLFKVYNKQEWLREYYRFSKYTNENTRTKLKSKFGIDLKLPGKFRYESIDNSYAVMIFPERSRQMDLKIGAGSISKANFIQSGIMVWQYPFTDSTQLEPQKLMMMRDTILKKYAKHEMEGVYMGTQYHPAVIPVYERLKIGDVEGYQFRGLYKFTGAAEPSGGRFWSFHFKQPYRNTIVAISGYLDVPPTMDPYLDLNRIRAVIYSLKVVK